MPLAPKPKVRIGPPPALAAAMGFSTRYKCRQCSTLTTTVPLMTTHLSTHSPATPGYVLVYLKV